MIQRFHTNLGQSLRQLLAAPRARLALALLIGCVAGALCLYSQVRSGWLGGDIIWPHCAARAIFASENPYASCPPTPGLEMSREALLRTYPTNPMTSALLFAPLAPLSPALAGAVFIGLSTALLTWGLMRDGEYWRLLALLAFPFWQALQAVQWSILLMALAFIPQLLFLALCKPHLGLTIVLPRLSRSVVIGCALFGGLSLLAMPAWPWRWWTQASSTYGGFVPLLALPAGPLLALAALTWRSREGQTLGLLACVPQRAFYDQLLLFLIPRRPRELLALVLGSWLAYLCWFFSIIDDARLAIVLGEYYPCLAMLLVRWRRNPLPDAAPPIEQRR